MNAWIDIHCATDCDDERMAVTILLQHTDFHYIGIDGVQGEVRRTDPRIGERISDQLADAGVTATVFAEMYGEDKP